MQVAEESHTQGDDTSQPQAEGGPARATTFLPGGLFKQVTMSWTLPLTHHHLRYAMLSRPNGELTRASQHHYQLIGRPPSSRQYDQPLIREGPNDYIMLRRGAKKLLRSLQPNGNYHLTKLRKELLQGQLGAPTRHHLGRAAKRPEPRHAL